MTTLTVEKITNNGGIIHFTDGSRALVNVKDHHISSQWIAGGDLNMICRKNTYKGAFNLHSTDEEFVDCAWYLGNEQIV